MKKIFSARWDEENITAKDFINFHNAVFMTNVEINMKSDDKFSLNNDISNVYSFEYEAEDEENVLYKKGERVKRRKTNIKMKRRKFEHRTEGWRKILQKQGNRIARYDAHNLSHKALLENDYDLLDCLKAKQIAREKHAITVFNLCH